MKLVCRTILILMLAFGSGAIQSARASDDIKIERLFGPEIPAKYKHPACIAQLANGDLYIVYYGGDGEYATNTAVFGSRRKKGETKWSTPKAIADTPFRSEGNGVIWQSPQGTVWLYYVIRYGETWSNSRICAKISPDGAETWSDPIIVAFEEGMMVRAHPIALKGGDHLVPIYHEMGHDPELVGAESTSLFLRFSDKDKQWTETNRIKSKIGNIQPAVAAMTDDYLIAYCRRGGGYDGRADGRIVRSESRDGGKTWSGGTETNFPNPNAAVDFIKLKNGHLLLVYNDSLSDRTPLTGAISTDNDKTYPNKRNIIEGNGDFGYPTAIQTDDGKIIVSFTSDERTVVNIATFDESAILKPAK